MDAELLAESARHVHLVALTVVLFRLNVWVVVQVFPVNARIGIVLQNVLNELRTVARQENILFDREGSPLQIAN